MASRTFFPLQSLYASASPATGAAASGLTQLYRVQSFGISDSYSRENVLQLGQTDPVDQVINAAPTVNLNFNWLGFGVRNESGIGFNTNGTQSALGLITSGTSKEKNYYVGFSAEGTDSVGDASTTRGVIGVGNAVIASYSVQGSVGQFPQVSVEVNGLNMKIDVTSSGIDPASVTPSTSAPITNHTVLLPTATSGNAGQIPVIRDDGIRVTLSANPFGVSSFCVQSFNLQVPLNLVPQQCLGDRFPYSREITFPIPITVGLQANARDFAAGNLATFICSDTKFDCDIQLYAPGCSGSLGSLMAGYRVTNMKFDGREIGTDVSSQNTTISLNFTAQVGASAGAGKSVFLMSGSVS